MNKRKVLSILLLALITVTLAVSCSSNIDAPAANSEELAYVTFGNGHSRELGTSYLTEDYDELFWFYTADKDDNYGTTGVTSSKQPVSATYDSQGVITTISEGLGGQVGPFSQGKWNFELFAYKNANVSNGSVTYENLVYQGNATGVILKGGDVKNVPVSVSLKGDYGTLDFSGAHFAWFKETPDQVVGNGDVYLRINISGTADMKNSSGNNIDVNKTIITRVTSPDYKISNGLIFDDSYGAGKFPAGYYTCTVQAYVAEDLNSNKTDVNPGSTYKASQAFGLRVYGNATTKISGDLTEGLFAEVSFDVAKQDMKVFVPSSTSSTKIENINVFPDTTTVTGVTKSTTVEFDQGALTAVANKTLQLDVKVTPVESANEKFNITGTDQNNKSAFAGIDVTLWATNSTGSSEVNSFTEGKYATVTTYIAKGLTGVAVKYNGTDKEQPIATANTGVGVDTTIADILTSDTGTALGYNPSTGLLRFKTNHFSEYYVLAKCVALNETTNVGYGDLQKAFDNAKDSDVIKLIDNITSTTGFSFNNNAKVTFDLNEKILKVTNDTANNHRALKVTAGTLTIKNGTIDARNVNGNGDPEDFNNKDQHTQGIYGTVRVETANVNSPAKAILENLALYNNHLWEMSVKVCENSNAEVKNCNFISRVGGCIEAEGGIVNVESSSFSQEVTSNYSSYISTGIAVSYLGSITVNNTESFSVSGAQALYVYSSGGEIIVNGGNYSATGNSAVIEADFDATRYGSQNGIDEFKNSHNGKASVVVVNDGNFVGSFAYGGNTEYCQIKIKGGTFSTNPSDYVPAFGYKVEQNTDVNFVVSEAPLEINNAQDLMNFAASVNAGNDYAGKTIILNRDIDLAEKTWVPIGEGNRSDRQHVFKGTFDGNNHTIKNLSSNGYDPSTVAVYDKGDMLYAYGLFGIVEGATIQNVKFENISIDTAITVNDTPYKGDSVGAVVGYAFKNATITGCEVSNGSIKGHDAVAGIVGRAYGNLENTDKFVISGCKNSADIVATKGKAAGIVGIIANVNGSLSEINSCTNRGKITVGTYGNSGGIIGLARSTNISNSNNFGNIESSSCLGSVGGIAGEYTHGGTIFNTNNEGNIIIKGKESSDNYGVGGIVGWVRYNYNNHDQILTCKLEQCKNTGNISATSITGVGGVVGQAYWSVEITNCKNLNAQISNPNGNMTGAILGGFQYLYKNDKVTPDENYSSSRTNTLTIKDCTASGSVISTGVNTNTLVGHAPQDGTETTKPSYSISNNVDNVTLNPSNQD